jgi:hypothetical protein
VVKEGIDKDLDERITRAARKFCKERCPAWEEDFAQELRLRAFEAGHEVASTWKMRLQLSVIAQAWFGRRRSGAMFLEQCEERETLEELVRVSPVQPDAIIAWHRLKELWPKFSAHEKAGIYTILTDDFAAETARKMRCGESTMKRGMQSALDRLANPKEAKRKQEEERRKSRERANAWYAKKKEEAARCA